MSADRLRNALGHRLTARPTDRSYRCLLILDSAVVVLAGGWLSGAATTPVDRKGRLRKIYADSVTRGEDGKPVVGGPYGLEAETTPMGDLLIVRVDGPDGRVRRLFLDYPTDRDAPSDLRLAEKPGPGCYWNVTTLRAQSDIWSIAEFQAYSAREGPLKGRFLGQTTGALSLFRSNELTTPSLSPFGQLIQPKGNSYVGRLYDYDNLDDGK